MRLKRLKRFTGPSSALSRTLVFLALLVLGGLVWDQLYGLDSDHADGNAPTAPEVKDRPAKASNNQGVKDYSGGFRIGIISKLDPQNDTLTISADGEEILAKVDTGTKVMDVSGQRLRSLFNNEGFKVGAAVAFGVSGDTLLGIRLQGDPARGGRRNDIRRGKVASIDPEKRTITFNAAGKEVEAVVTDQSNFFGAKGKDAAERLRTLAVGTDVMFVVRPKDGKNFLLGVRTISATSAR